MITQNSTYNDDAVSGMPVEDSMGMFSSAVFSRTYKLCTVDMKGSRIERGLNL